MKHLSLKRSISLLLALMLCVSCLTLFATTAVAEAKTIQLPIIINGENLVGGTSPLRLINLPAIEGAEYCDADCDCNRPDYYQSNRWYNNDGSVATQFVDDEYYVYVITIHPKTGYAFPTELTATSDIIKVSNVQWFNSSNAIIESDCISVAFRYRYDNFDGEIVGDYNIEAPISIDGSALRIITEPTSLGLSDTGEYTHCDGVACGCSDAYLSDTWFDERGDVVTEFVDGNEYFYQVTIHLNEGYTLNPNLLPEHAINVTGIAWDFVRAYYEEDRLYAEFHIESYNSSTGIPDRYSADVPYVFNGLNLGGLNTPMGLGLKDTEEYYHCYDGCGSNYWYASDTWFTTDDKIATEFVDGEKYYYQISLHPQAGYYFNLSYLSENEMPIMVTGIKWDYMSWSYHGDGGIYAYFYMTYDASTGVPFAKTIDQIVIDGASMAGATAPESIDVPATGEEYYFCGNDECCEFGTEYPSFAWFDADDVIATEFVDGEQYYFQVIVHPECGYEFDAPLGESEDNGVITVSGIDWEKTYSWYDVTENYFYTEFWITYDASVGIPGIVTVDTIESLEITGVTLPTIGQTVDEYFSNTAAPTVVPDYALADAAFFKDGEQLPNGFAFVEGETYQLALAFDVLLAEGGTVTVDKGTFKSAENIDGTWLDIRIEFTLSAEPDYIVGDVNGNGKIDARDYLLLKRAYFGTYTLNCKPEVADINGNGKLDARDYLLLKRAYFGTYTIK